MSINGQLVSVGDRTAAMVATGGDPVGKYVLASADAGDISNYKGIKAIRVYVAVGSAGATVTLLGQDNDSGDTPYAIAFPEGVTYEPIRPRRITAIGAGATVHLMI